MAEAKSKKIRVYKLASEYNIAVESLVEFLESKGHKLKSHMSMLTDEMIAEINEHFKKDIEKSQKHYQKIAEFKQKREEKARKDDLVEKEETREEEIPPVEIKISEASPTEEPAVIEEIKEEIEEEVKGKEKKGKKEDKPEKKGAKPRGLKVIGKIDLEEGTDFGLDF